MFIGARLAAAIPCGATAGLLYLIGSTLWSRPVGVTAALLWAISPMSVVFAGWHRAMTQSVILHRISLMAIREATRRPTLLGGCLCGSAIGLAVLTKTTGLLSAGYQSRWFWHWAPPGNGETYFSAVLGWLSESHSSPRPSCPGFPSS